MTNPQWPGQPSGHGDPTVWARPAAHAPPAQPTQVTPEPPQQEPPAQHIQRASPQSYPATPSSDQPSSKDPFPPVKTTRRLRDPLSLVLILVIVAALAVAGLLGGELYARHRADSVVAGVVECVVQDGASASFGIRPFLLQHFTRHYSGISVQTAGNRVREAKGMKVDLKIDDVRLQDTGNSRGTIGALDATITWSSEGIQQTVQDAIPLFGGIVTGVSTNPSDGTIELRGALGSVTAKPQVADNGVSLRVVNVSGLGFTLPREIVQPALDAFTSTLTKNYPLGIHADSVVVTDTGVTSHFSTRNAAIPQGTDDPCFAGL